MVIYFKWFLLLQILASSIQEYAHKRDNKLIDNRIKKSNISNQNLSLIHANFANHSHHHHGDEHHQKNHHHNKTIQVDYKKSRKTKRKLSSLQSENSLPHDYVAAIIGKEVTLVCTIEGLTSEDKLIWLRMPKGEVLTLNTNRVTQDTRISAKCDSVNTPCWMLTIESTTESDVGYYVCQTSLMVTKYTYLDILVPPKILNRYSAEPINVDQDKNATVSCFVYGRPKPQVFWFKIDNGTPTEMENFRNLETINLTIRSDTPNELECVADNGVAPTVSQKIMLNIRYTPKISFMNERVYQRRDRDVIFDCMVKSNPEPKIFWMKNNIQIIESKKYSLIDFKNGDHYFYRLYINALAEHDFGDYYCLASNNIGDTKAKIELIEIIPQTIASTTTKSTKPLKTVNNFGLTNEITNEIEFKTMHRPAFHNHNHNQNKQTNKSHNNNKHSQTHNNNFNDKTSHELLNFNIIDLDSRDKSVIHRLKDRRKQMNNTSSWSDSIYNEVDRSSGSSLIKPIKYIKLIILIQQLFIISQSIRTYI